VSMLCSINCIIKEDEICDTYATCFELRTEVESYMYNVFSPSPDTVVEAIIWLGESN
jgi:hypothetical protein